MTDHEQKHLTADCWRLFMFPLFIRPTVNTTQNILTRWWIKINNIRTARSAAASRFPTKGNWNWDVPTVHSFPHPFKLPPSSILSFLHVQLFTFPTTSAAYRMHTHISSFHLLCSVCRGPAVTNQASNGPCKNQQRTETWWDGGWGGWWRWRGVWRDWETIFNLKEINQSPTVSVSLYVLLWGDAREAVNERNDVWKGSRDAEEVIVFKKAQKCTSGLWVNTLPPTWAPYTLRSISQMDYLPNGPWQCSFLWLGSYASNIFHSDKSEHCCCPSVRFKTRFTSTYTRYYLSLLPLFIIHLCFSGDKVTGRKIVTGTVCDCETEIQIGYISFPLSPLHFFSERPSHRLHPNQVDHILATD